MPFQVEEIVKILNQVHKLVEILFLRDPLTKDMHTLSFIRGHRTSQGRTYLMGLT